MARNKRHRKIAEGLSWQIFLMLWCANHKVGDKETLKDGEILERVETGWQMTLPTALKFVIVTGKITV